MRRCKKWWKFKSSPRDSGSSSGSFLFLSPMVFFQIVPYKSCNYYNWYIKDLFRFSRLYFDPLNRLSINYLQTCVQGSHLTSSTEISIHTEVQILDEKVVRRVKMWMEMVSADKHWVLGAREIARTKFWRSSK